MQLSDLTQPVVPAYVNGITTIVAASAAAWVGKKAGKPRKHDHTLDVVVEVELSAAVRLSVARFASASREPLTSVFLGPVIRLRSVRTRPDRSGC